MIYFQSNKLKRQNLTVKSKDNDIEEENGRSVNQCFVHFLLFIAFNIVYCRKKLKASLSEYINKSKIRIK